jgi:ankyrin repeat protein
MEYGQLYPINYILKRGLVDKSVINGEAFMRACHGGQLEIVKLLVKYGTTAHIKNQYALNVVLISNYKEIVKFLIDNGAVMI